MCLPPNRPMRGQCNPGRQESPPPQDADDRHDDYLFDKSEPLCGTHLALTRPCYRERRRCTASSIPLHAIRAPRFLSANRPKKAPRGGVSIPPGPAGRLQPARGFRSGPDVVLLDRGLTCSMSDGRSVFPSKAGSSRRRCHGNHQTIHPCTNSSSEGERNYTVRNRS